MGKTECHCPNCNGPAMREGDEITCAACDATFIVKQKEIKVKQIGPMEDLQQRVGRLEAWLSGKQPPKKADPVPPSDGRGPDGSDKDGEEGGEFIVGHGR